jgi:hypothetical protein
MRALQFATWSDEVERLGALSFEDEVMCFTRTLQIHYFQTKADRE